RTCSSSCSRIASIRRATIRAKDRCVFTWLTPWHGHWRGEGRGLSPRPHPWESSTPQHPSPGNRERGIVGMGNDETGGAGGEKEAAGCGVGRSSSPIPHSRLPIPKSGVVGRGTDSPFPIADSHVTL